MMNLFNVKYCAKRVGDLARIECEFKHANPETRGTDTAESLKNLKKTLARSIKAMDGLQMERCQRQLQDILKEAETKPLLAQQLAIHARSAAKAVTEELHHRKFLYVVPAFYSYIDHERLFGDVVWQRFPSARPDVTEAGNCLAAECNTAAVFHLMRVTEWGLRAFATHLGVRSLRSQKKSGRVHLTPVAYSTWETILKQLGARVDTKLKKLRPGPRKQAWQEFYGSALEEIHAIKDTYRNHVMHTRQQFAPEDAAAVLSHVKRLMVRLSSNVSEV